MTSLPPGRPAAAPGPRGEPSSGSSLRSVAATAAGARGEPRALIGPAGADAAASLRAGQLAGVAGVGRQTLRYYERLGLLASPRRSPGGHRLYPAEAVTSLRVIKAAQQLGFSLREIGELLRGRRSGRGQGGLRQRVPARLAEIEAHIAELEQAATALRAAQAAGCDDLIECADLPGCPLPFPPAV